MKSTVCCLVKSLEHSTLVLHYQVLSLLSPSKKLKQNGFNTMHALGQIILCLLHDRMTARMITQLKNNDPSNQFLMVLRIKIFFPLIDIPKLFHQRESSIYYRNKKKKNENTYRKIPDSNCLCFTSNNQGGTIIEQFARANVIVFEAL